MQPPYSKNKNILAMTSICSNCKQQFIGGKKQCLRCRTRDNEKKKRKRAREKQLLKPRSQEEKSLESLLQRKASYLKNSALTRAKQYDLPFTIDTKFIYKGLREGVCQQTGLSFDLNNKKRGAWSPSLDQHLPRGGYTPENTKIVVWAYNQFKYTFTSEEYLLLLQQCLRAYGFNPDTNLLLPSFSYSDATSFHHKKLMAAYDQLKHRAKKAGSTVEIKRKEWKEAIFSNVCQITGIPFNLAHYILEEESANNWSPLGNQDRCLPGPWIPSPHQIISGQGYTYANTNIVCWAYNVAKADFTDEEFITLIKALGIKEGMLSQNPDKQDILPRETFPKITNKKLTKSELKRKIIALDEAVIMMEYLELLPCKLESEIPGLNALFTPDTTGMVNSSEQPSIQSKPKKKINWADLVEDGFESLD